MSLRRARSVVKQAYRRAVGKAIRVPLVKGIRTERHGSEYGGWTICPDAVNAKAVVYSIGIGEDATFDTSLIATFGLTVHAFDPTPRVIEWVSKHDLPSDFVFHPYGLADRDGMADFFPPEKNGYISHSMIHNVGHPPIRVPVRRLTTIMSELGHRHIDILKMDIEGAEYAVIDDILAANVPIKQLVVEFHHRFASAGISATKFALKKLIDNGYLPVAIGDSGNEYSFIHSRQLREHPQQQP